MNNKCYRLSYTIHNMFDEAAQAECVCEPGKGCNYVNPRACKRCNWVNTWTDSGDRGAAQHDHDRGCQ